VPVAPPDPVLPPVSAPEPPVSAEPPDPVLPPVDELPPEPVLPPEEEAPPLPEDAPPVADLPPVPFTLGGSAAGEHEARAMKKAPVETRSADFMSILRLVIQGRSGAIQTSLRWALAIQKVSREACFQVRCRREPGYALRGFFSTD
jgi:hypothetical protein